MKKQTTKQPVVKSATIDPTPSTAQLFASLVNAEKVITAMQARMLTLSQQLANACERIDAIESLASLASLAYDADPVTLPFASIESDPVPVKVSPKAPKTNGSAPKVSPKASKRSPLDDLLSRCVSVVVAGQHWSDKVTSLFEGDLRCFLTPALRKEIKTYRTAHDMSLVSFSRALVAAYEKTTGKHAVDLFD